MYFSNVVTLFVFGFIIYTFSNNEDNKYINFQNINWSITLCLTIEKNDHEKIIICLTAFIQLQ